MSKQRMTLQKLVKGLSVSDEQEKKRLRAAGKNLYWTSDETREYRIIASHNFPCLTASPVVHQNG